MPDKPQQSILDRSTAIHHARDHFNPQIGLLKDLTNYGSNLVIRAFESSPKDMAAVVICGVLLKQIVRMMDAVQLLVEAGTVQPAFLPARSAYEASLYLDWVLVGDTERKTKAYLVANYRQERLWAARATKGTTEEVVFKKITDRLGFDIHTARPTLAEEVERHLAEVNRILAQPELADVDHEFDKARGKRKRDPNWYEICGAKSIRDIARLVDRLVEYEFFYVTGAQVAHSASYKSHLLFTDGRVTFKPVRHLENINQLLTFTVVSVVQAYKMVLAYFRPEELEAFARKYAEDWRDAVMSIKRVEYRNSENQRAK